MTSDHQTSEESRAKLIDELLVYINLFETLDNAKVRALKFRKTFPLMPSQVNQAVILADTGDDRVSGHMDDRIDAILNKVQYVGVNVVGGGFPGNIELNACRELWGSEKERAVQAINSRLPLDGRRLTSANRLIDLWTIDIDQEGRATKSTRTTWNYVRGKLYVTDPSCEKATEDNLRQVASISAGVLFEWSRRVSWVVDVGFPGNKDASIALITDAIGVKECFRWRDVEHGRKRRDALLHWVNEHWRQNRKDPEIENYVREHLRGATAFRWFGMDGSVSIPRREEDKIEQSKRNRNIMRILGTDKRPHNTRG